MELALKDGTIVFKEKDVLHNPNGPAVLYPDGKVEYWIDGRQILGTVKILIWFINESDKYTLAQKYNEMFHIEMDLKEEAKLKLDSNLDNDFLQWEYRRAREAKKHRDNIWQPFMARINRILIAKGLFTEQSLEQLRKGLGAARRMR